MWPLTTFDGIYINLIISFYKWKKLRWFQENLPNDVLTLTVVVPWVPLGSNINTFRQIVIWTCNFIIFNTYTQLIMTALFLIIFLKLHKNFLISFDFIWTKLFVLQNQLENEYNNWLSNNYFLDIRKLFFCV